jgi:hypothetical protein
VVHGDERRLGARAHVRLLQDAGHVVLDGLLGENMPALRALDPQISVDIVSYLPQLPKE